MMQEAADRSKLRFLSQRIIQIDHRETMEGIFNKVVLFIDEALDAEAADRSKL